MYVLAMCTKILQWKLKSLRLNGEDSVVDELKIVKRVRSGEKKNEKEWEEKVRKKKNHLTADWGVEF